MTPPNLAAVTWEILEACSADFEGLWSVLRAVDRSFPRLDNDKKKEATMQVIRDLLTSGRVIAGEFLPSREFSPWSEPPEGILARIEEAWNTLNRDPDIGEIVWFTTVR